MTDRRIRRHRPALEPARISDDPGRPDDVILGAPGAMLVIISGPSGVGKDTIIARDARGSPTRARTALRRDRHDPRAARGRGRRRRLSLRDRARSSCGIRAARRVPRGERGPRQLVRRAARPGARRRCRPAVTRSSRSTCRAPRSSRSRSRGAADLRRPADARDAVLAAAQSRATETADELEIRQRNAARRAGAPGRLRPRRRQRDRARSARTAERDRRDHRRGARCMRTGGSASRSP